MSQWIDFVSGGSQVGVTAPIPKMNVPIAGGKSFPHVSFGGFATATAINLRSVGVAPRDGRQNKKSQWDKVDGGRESISAIAAHAGARYTAFVQQRQREAEEKRSGEKKLERS